MIKSNYLRGFASFRAFLPLAIVLEERPKRGFLNGNRADSWGNPDRSWRFFRVPVGLGFLFMVLVDRIFVFLSVFDRQLQTRKAQLESKSMLISSVSTTFSCFQELFVRWFTEDATKPITEKPCYHTQL